MKSRKKIYEDILDSDEKGEGKLFFIQGHRGTAAQVKHTCGGQ